MARADGGRAVALRNHLAVGEAVAELQLAGTPQHRALPKENAPFG